MKVKIRDKTVYIRNKFYFPEGKQGERQEYYEKKIYWIFLVDKQVAPRWTGLIYTYIYIYKVKAIQVLKKLKQI